MPAQAASPITLGAGQLTTGAGWYRGITIRETAAATAVVKLFDNTAGSGTLLGVYALTANSSIDFDVNNPRIITKGIFVTITGTVEGSVFV